MTSPIHRALALVLVAACSAREPARETRDATGAELVSNATSPELLDGGVEEVEDAPMDAATGAAPDAAGALSATIACLENLRIQCERRTECGLYSFFEDCWQRFYRDCPDILFSPGSAQTPEQTLACAGAWRDVSCEDLWLRVAPACTEPGTREPGETCLFNAQCASRVCSVSGGSKCGVCLALRNEGETCRGATAQPCAAGLSCVDAGVCVSEPARRFLPLGATCTSGECGSNLCALGADGGAFCVATPRLGESCAHTGLCAGDDGSYCDVSNVCLEAPSAGAPCAQSSFGHDACDGFSECDATLDPPRCRALPRAGESCSRGCSDGSACSCVDAACSARRCVFPRRLGEPCDPATFSVCDEPVSRCQAGTCVLARDAMQNLFETVCGP